MSGHRFPTPTGWLSRRLVGAERIMRERARAAREAARYAQVDGQVEFAASLRGKARGYAEAADLIAALDNGRRLPQRPWGRDADSEPLSADLSPEPAQDAPDDPRAPGGRTEPAVGRGGGA